jgi:hypothetical protein
MRKSLLGLGLALLLAILLGALAVDNVKAGAGTAGRMASAAPHQTLAQPVRIWRDCQRIAHCNGCTPVFHCRSCSYQRTCRNNYGLCGWTDVCVWGPYIPVAPRGVPIR